MAGPAVNEARFGARDAQPLDNLTGDARDVLKGLFGDVNPQDLPIEARIAKERLARVRAIAARKFSDAEGVELLEALCDATVRRPLTLGPYGKSCDEVALYAKQREGQNETTYLLLAWIAEGRSEQPPQREGKTHAPQNATARNDRNVRPGKRGRRQRPRRPGGASGTAGSTE
jgi:hypothetical protein